MVKKEFNGEIRVDGIINKRLEHLEQDIELGIQSVGKALTEIHDIKAYQDKYDTFEAYCKTRWGFTDRHARDMIDAEAVRVKIGSLLPVETLKTQHLVAISKIPAAKQAQVAASVIAECQAENRIPTTKDYKVAAKEFIQPKSKPKPALVKDALEETKEEAVTVPKKVKPGNPELTPKERASFLKKSIKDYNAAMMRAVGDLHIIAPNKSLNESILKLFREIHAAIEAWK